jgi:hypothetical protein
MLYRPQATNRDVATESVDGELVVYDPGTQMAHCLSADAAAVWECCDGHTSLADIAVASSVELSAVERAVDELRGCGLLDDAPILGRGYSRREAATKFARVGGAALLAPLVYSVAIPAVAAAASGANGSPAPNCSQSGSNKKGTDTTDCTSGTCYHEPTGSARICVAANCVVDGSIGCSVTAPCCNPATTCSAGSC